MTSTHHKALWSPPTGALFRSSTASSLVASLIGLATLCPATSAQDIVQIIDSSGDGAGNPLTGPRRTATDAAGNVYVTGGPSDNAFKIEPGGTITEIIDATGDGAGNTVWAAEDVAVDAAGNVYVASRHTNQVFKIEPGGTITVVLSPAGDGAGNFCSQPIGLATDTAGNLYVACFTSDNAFKVEPGGVVTEIIDATAGGVGTFDQGFAIVPDAAGNVYVAGHASSNVYQVTPGGTITEVIGSAGDGAGNALVNPRRLAVDGAGNVYVTGSDSDNVFKVTPGGTITEIIDALGDGVGNPLDQPNGVATDAAGNVYVAGFISSNAFRITPGGIITEILDSTGDGAGNPITSPRDIALDSAGNVFVPGSSSSNVLKIAGGERLALSVASTCPDDAFPDPETGYQIVVELDMVWLTGDISGFAAFLAYDASVLTYRGDLTSYSATPFSLHISDPLSQVNVPPGEIWLDGSVGFGDPATSQDALLATLVFDVGVGCDPATPPITFRAGGDFPSELSLGGTPIETLLLEAGAYTLDDTAPVFDAYSNVTQAADASLTDSCAGAIVNFTPPTASDSCDASPVIVCTPAPGSYFPAGTTTVTCTATDACNNQSTMMFDVTVTATNVIQVDLEMAGVLTSVARCIRLAVDDCTFTDLNLTFVDHDANGATAVRAIAEFELPCGEYTSLCVKDQQHTMWNTVPLLIVDGKYVADPTGLLGGDTDDDGDVDINDVTHLLFQYGSSAAAASCPWDGTTRDADFSNNGNVSGEDYTYLAASWLMTSTCACAGSLPYSVPGNQILPNRKRVTTPVEMAVDFHPDGWIDAKDVELFEKRNGLPDTLSKRMRRN